MKKNQIRAIIMFQKKDNLSRHSLISLFYRITMAALYLRVFMYHNIPIIDFPFCCLH